MDLTPENKMHIDSLSIEELLSHCRYAPFGDKWFQGETGTYWGDRMKELSSLPGGAEEYTAASKRIGW